MAMETEMFLPLVGVAPETEEARLVEATTRGAEIPEDPIQAVLIQGAPTPVVQAPVVIPVRVVTRAAAQPVVVQPVAAPQAEVLALGAAHRGALAPAVGVAVTRISS